MPTATSLVTLSHSVGRIGKPLDIRCTEAEVAEKDKAIQGSRLRPRVHNLAAQPCLLWPNGWMDQDATWYEGRPRPRPHCITLGPSSTTTTTTTVLQPFVWDYPGEPVPEETLTHHPDHHPIFISFFHLPRSIPSSLFKLCA